MRETMKTLWSSSATTYAAAAGELETYQRSNLRLAEMMDLEAGMRIVDLACGSGETTFAAFAVEPELSHCWAVDAVPEMLTEARSRLAGLPVTLVEATAEEFADDIGPGTAERLLCNGAFFQFGHYGKALAQIRRVLTGSGRLGLTVPGPSNDSEYVDHLARAGLGRPPARRARTPPKPPAAGEERAGRRRKRLRGRPPCNHRTIAAILEATGWEPLESELITVPTSREELVRWLTIPVFRWPQWRHMEDRELHDRLTAAFDEIDFHPQRAWCAMTARPVAAVSS